MLDELIDMRRIEAEMAESSASSNPKEYASGIFQSIGPFALSFSFVLQARLTSSPPS